MDHGFSNVVTTVAQLAELYREPSQLVHDKTIDHIDETARQFISASTFVLIGTGSATGRGDVSPKGGHAGFVKVLDDHRIAIPDLNGNNRVDTLRNLTETDAIGLLFLVPGTGEMLRVTGRAVVTTDDNVLDLFQSEFRRPTTAIGVVVDEAMLHCAKAIRRGGLWAPDTWAGGAPSPGEMLVAHLGSTDLTAAQFDARLSQGYEAQLALDAPV
jgi:PPOX class probable FMN-dependent enzyme